MRYIMLVLCMFFLVLSGINKKNKKIYVLFSALVLLIFASFREYIFSEQQIGNDYYSYMKWFDNIWNIEISISNDFLFNILMLFINKFTGNYLVFIFITSFLWVYSIYKFSIDNSKNYIFTILLFLTFGIFELGFSAIRQAMAISVFLLSFNYIKQKKLFKYIVGIVIASLFHSSAIILLFIYPFINMKLSITKKTMLLIIIAIIITLLISSGMYEELLIKFVPDYELKYENIGSELNSNYTVFGISILTFVMLYMLDTAKQNLVKKDNPEYMYLLLLCLFSYIATLHPTLGRMLQYFMPAIPLIVPTILYYEKGKDVQKIGNLAVISIFLIIFII